MEKIYKKKQICYSKKVPEVREVMTSGGQRSKKMLIGRPPARRRGALTPTDRRRAGGSGIFQIIKCTTSLTPTPQNQKLSCLQFWMTGLPFLIYDVQ